MKADLDGLLHAALQKKTDELSFAIYLDAKLPIAVSSGPAARANDGMRVPDALGIAGDAAAPIRSESVMKFQVLARPATRQLRAPIDLMGGSLLRSYARHLPDLVNDADETTLAARGLSATCGISAISEDR